MAICSICVRLKLPMSDCRCRAWAVDGVQKLCRRRDPISARISTYAVEKRPDFSVPAKVKSDCRCRAGLSTGIRSCEGEDKLSTGREAGAVDGIAEAVDCKGSCEGEDPSLKKTTQMQGMPTVLNSSWSRQLSDLPGGSSAPSRSSPISLVSFSLSRDGFEGKRRGSRWV
ncbi:hypothetical protein LXL04_031269 [Taraxacum kok-saghyz]